MCWVAEAGMGAKLDLCASQPCLMCLPPPNPDLTPPIDFALDYSYPAAWPSEYYRAMCWHVTVPYVLANDRALTVSTGVSSERKKWYCYVCHGYGTTLYVLTCMLLTTVFRCHG